MLKKFGVAAVAGGMLVAAAPAAADTATCRLKGPMSADYTRSHGLLVEGGRARIRSAGEIVCAGTLGGQAVSTVPGHYRITGWAVMRQKCTLVTDSYLRLDAQVPRLITIWQDRLVDATADLNLLGPLNGAAVSGIGAAADQGLDIAGESTWTPRPNAGRCTHGNLSMVLTLRDGANRPPRSTKPRPAAPQPEADASATRSTQKSTPKKKAVKRCARKARTAKAKRAARRCRRAAARRR